MIRKSIVFGLFVVAACSCYPLRNARIIDGTEKEKTVWVCVPEEQEPLNVGGLMCARIDHVLAHPQAEPADAGSNGPATM